MYYLLSHILDYKNKNYYLYKMKNSNDDTRKESLVMQTQREILEYINNNGYKINDILPKENEMADIIGVSRVVIREAYSGLRTLGFLETKRKRGTIIASPRVFEVLDHVMLSGFIDQKSTQDLYELRLMLEIGMADFVISNRTDEYMQELERIVEQEEATEDSDELRSLDIKFHSVLYRMSGNKSLQYFQHILSKLFSVYDSRRPNWQSIEMMTHKSLIHFLKVGDITMFRAAMRIHLEYQFLNKERYLKLFKQKK